MQGLTGRRTADRGNDSHGAPSADVHVVDRRIVADRMWPRVRTFTVVAVSTVVFVGHAAFYRGWLIDDAGISLAYAFNLADGAGLVAQPGSKPVEGFSNPLLVFLMATFSWIGLIDRDAIDGMDDPIVFMKTMAIALHLVVLAGVVSIVGSILGRAHGWSTQRTDRSLRPSRVDVAALFAGIILGLFPPYVIWVVSGLENALYAAEIALLTAVVARASTHRRTTAPYVVIAVGLLAAAIALTRPDGAIFVLTLLLLAMLDRSRPVAERALRTLPGLTVFAVLVLPYLTFRRVTFGRWLPNTATAKAQSWPVPVDLLRIGDVVTSFGWPLVMLAVIGTTVAFVAPMRPTNRMNRKALASVWSIVGLAVAAYAVLPPDWMPEMRFATAAWPLLAVTTAVGLFAVVDLASHTLAHSAARTVAPILIGVGALTCVGVVGWTWHDRATAFRRSPTVTLCNVAERSGAWYNAAAEALGLDPSRSSLLTPDLGGTLLVSNLEVIDLAGLTDVTIARYLRNGDSAGLADHLLSDRRPTFVRLHGFWTGASGLMADPRFANEYVALHADTDFVRRDAIDERRLPAATQRLADLDREWQRRAFENPVRSCSDLLATGVP